MSELKRTRMISLRIPEEEYENAQRVYRSLGARSFSDFARQAIRRVVETSLAEGASCPRLVKRDSGVEKLETRFPDGGERNGRVPSGADADSMKP